MLTPKSRGLALFVLCLRNQFREQLLTLFRNDRVLPLGSLEGFDDSKQPQNKASDVIYQAQQHDRKNPQDWYMYQYLVNDRKSHPEHNPGTAEKYTLHSPVPNQLILLFDKIEDNPCNRRECGGANPGGNIRREPGIATGI